MKIALLDCHQNNYDEIARLTSPSKTLYCKKYGYGFITEHFDNIGKFPTWGRVLKLQQHLPAYDWVLYLDTDTIITNFDIDIESQIDDAFDILVGTMPDFHTGQPTHLSTSSILIKRSDWSFDFLDKWWKTNCDEYRSDGPAVMGHGGKFYEQSAFQFLYEHGEAKHIRIMPNHWFNAVECNHTSSDFLIHFVRQEPPKLPRIKNFMRRPTGRIFL